MCCFSGSEQSFLIAQQRGLITIQLQNGHRRETVCLYSLWDFTHVYIDLEQMDILICTDLIINMRMLFLYTFWPFVLVYLVPNYLQTVFLSLAY